MPGPGSRGLYQGEHGRLDIRSINKEKSFDRIYRMNRINSSFIIPSILLILSNLPRPYQ
jgi:hypothetical protein